MDNPAGIEVTAFSEEGGLTGLEEDTFERKADSLVMEVACPDTHLDMMDAGDAVQRAAFDVGEATDQKGQSVEHEESCETGQPRTSADHYS